MHGNFFQNSSKIHVKNCDSSDGQGGGLAVYQSLLQSAGKMEFANCSADAGGGMVVSRNVFLGGVTAFSGCNALGSDSGGSCEQMQCFGVQMKLLRKLGSGFCYRDRFGNP